MDAKGKGYSNTRSQCSPLTLRLPLFPWQLDSFKCLELYKELLGTLESKQRVEFPNYYKVRRPLS